MTMINKLTARIAAHTVEAVTREQFDKWPSKRQNTYLDQHPTSTFRNGKGKADDHKRRTGKAGKAAIFTDKSGKTHSYGNAQAVEDHMDKLHSSQQRLAKMYHKPGADQEAIKQKMAHNDDHAKGLAHIASQGLVRMRKNDFAHEGIDTVNNYLKAFKPDRSTSNTKSTTKTPSSAPKTAPLKKPSAHKYQSEWAPPKDSTPVMKKDSSREGFKRLRDLKFGDQITHGGKLVTVGNRRKGPTGLHYHVYDESGEHSNLKVPHNDNTTVPHHGNNRELALKHSTNW